MGLLSGLALSVVTRSALAAGQFEVVSEWVTVDYSPGPSLRDVAVQLRVWIFRGPF